jgi:hypothetical protein
MSRLIELQRVQDAPSHLSVRVGDVLLIGATGGRVEDGGAAVELWGPFVSGVVGTDGSVVTPMGPPNTVLVRARGPGSATLELFTGDPFHGPRATRLVLTVEP